MACAHFNIPLEVFMVKYIGTETYRKPVMETYGAKV
jgi:predicted alternative tryptophan synthase beta-subunit